MSLRPALYGLGAVTAVGGYIYLACTNAVPTPPPFPELKPGVERICVTGFPFSPPTSHAHHLAALIHKKNQSTSETWYYWCWSPYYKFLWERFDDVNFDAHGAAHLKGHGSSPFVWIERERSSAEKEGKKALELIGGDDQFKEYAKKRFAEDKEIVDLANMSAFSCNPVHGSILPATTK